MTDFISVSPLKILKQSSDGQLGRGNLGVLISRAGVGKTACLIHIALEKIFHNQKLVHISLDEAADKVNSYYDVISSEFIKALNIKPSLEEYRLMIEKNRMLFAYIKDSFSSSLLRDNLKNLSENLDFKPDAIICDGINFEMADKKIFIELKKLAIEFNVEIWLSALSHRHITEVNKKGIPYPCHNFDDLFSIIIHIKSVSSGIFLSLLKDHDNINFPEINVKLDPQTFLAKN